MATMKVELTAGHTSPVSVRFATVEYSVSFEADGTALVPRPVGMRLVTDGICLDRGAVVIDGPWPAVPAWTDGGRFGGRPYLTPEEIAAVSKPAGQTSPTK